MDGKKYSVAFTGGSLLLHESVKVAELYITNRDWQFVRQYIFDTNLLQQRTLSSTKRFSHEIIQRLQTLTDPQLDLLCNGSFHEQKWLLWIAICKRYPLIGEFFIEIIREKIRCLNFVVYSEDYDAFFNAKAEWHDELENLCDSTKYKIKQVIFLMMRQAEIISDDNVIIINMLDKGLASIVAEENPDLLLLLPVFDSDIMEWYK